jgi:hypothetical protein
MRNADATHRRPRLAMISRREPQIALWLAGAAALLALAAGWAISRYPPSYVLAPVALGAAIAVGWWNRGALSGILVLFMINGVPFVNLQPTGQRSSGGLYDAVFLVLAAFLLFCAYTRPLPSTHRRIVTVACTWAGAYLAWWSFKAIGASPGVPLVPAVKYGRPFLYFIVLVPLALAAIHRRDDLVGFGGILAAGAALFSLGQIVKQATHANLDWLIHITQSNEFAGITRIYAPMNDLVIAMFPMAFAALLLGSRRWRLQAAGLMVLTGVANALSFTRAVYVSELVALISISFIWATGMGWRSRRIRYVFVLGAALLAVGLIAIGARTTTGTTSSSSPVQAVVSRAALGLTDVETGGGTTGYRLHEAHLELEVLGDHWLAGLGFLNPSYRFFPGLYEGAIQNDDLGSLSVLMTMGLIGLMFAYAPPIAGLVFLLRRRYGAAQYGGAMYLTAAIIGSITLGAVSTLSGMIVLGSMLALCVNWTLLTPSALRRASP